MGEADAWFRIINRSAGLIQPGMVAPRAAIKPSAGLQNATTMKPNFGEMEASDHGAGHNRRALHQKGKLYQPLLQNLAVGGDAQ